MRSPLFRLRRWLAADQLSSARRRWGLTDAQLPDCRILENPSPDQLVALIQSALPHHDVSSVKILEHGMDNIAVDVDDQWIFRFPRAKDRAHRLCLEAALLLFLRPKLAIEVPKLELCNSSTLFSYHPKIPGRHLTPQHYQSLGPLKRDEIAETIAVFFYQMHKLRPEILMSLNTIFDHEYVPSDEIIRKAAPLVPERLRGFLHTAITQYEHDEACLVDRVIGHFDCHGENMAIDPSSDKLNGIFDFSDAGLGNLHKDFHSLNRVSRDLTGRVIQRYQRLSGRTVNRTSVDLYTAVCWFSEIAYHTGAHQKALASVLDWYDQLQGWV